MTHDNTILIDGSFGEGGGQIVRTAVSLSAVTGKPCTISNIRKGRPVPGLKVQHVEGVNALARLCNAQVAGCTTGSTRLSFVPETVRGGATVVNIPTAGSIGLILQTLMVPSVQASAPLTITFVGGATHGKWAPPVPYIQRVLLPLLQKMGYRASIKIERYGYYPRGGAHILAVIEPSKLKPFSFSARGKLVSIAGSSHASEALRSARVAERQAGEAERILVAAEIESAYHATASAGSGIDLWAVHSDSVLGSGALGKRGLRAEEVGRRAAWHLQQLLATAAAVDDYAADQLLPFLALAGGGSITVPAITSHARTNAWVIERFLSVEFQIDQEKRTIAIK